MSVWVSSSLWDCSRRHGSPRHLENEAERPTIEVTTICELSLLKQGTSTTRETTAMPKAFAPVSRPHGIEIYAAGKPSTILGTLAIGVIAVVALYFGREVFIPMALAILLSFAL